ncbi:hypothetical protein H0A61_00481 [Koleobacter methoxysyntrophicus]|uniref:DUF3006 domain-containing protein n=1 Tax=Koleobacter methoxysyntrophicus TaxID=2751313 RepID=A0A8A0RI72_9FIRM|nr:DUF3006 domain-containing protein [Koleobacter methoxysyntrophicus]QSQ08161.1 hypothetical protein H0A61_00481 [Koleobacter methoxysyntrophicus]
MFVIDRFESDMAVIEYNGRTFNLPKNLLPKEAKEGDVLKISIDVDREETEKCRGKIKNLIMVDNLEYELCISIL